MADELRFVPLTGGPEDEIVFRRAARILDAGGLIVFPTDTFYALGADPFRAGAVDALYRLKGRPEDKPVLLLIGDSEWAQRLWAGIDPLLARLMDRFWPGPLTLVAPPGRGAPGIPPGRGLALRLPGNRLTLALLRAVGRPLTGTSANPAGRPPPRSALEAAAFFPAGADLFLEGGTYSGTGESTIVGLGDTGPVILREGVISREQVAAALRG